MNLRKYLKQKAAHYISGLLGGYFIAQHPLFSIILLILFILYEYSEWIESKDTFFPEVRSFTIGYVIGYIIWFTIFILLKYPYLY